jgi:alcohol dehydrogenase
MAHPLPNHFEFAFPVKIIAGHTALDNLAAELRQAQVARPLLLTDAGVLQAGLVDIVLEALADSGITLGALFSDTPLESAVGAVNDLAGLYRAKGCDGLIALGGGSVIDTAKGVNILVSLGGDEVRAYRGAEHLAGPLRPFFVLPTTAGTGSEATGAAVIVDPERGLKLQFVSEHLMPRVAFLDTRLTLTLPPRLTAATGMDAMTHAIEAYLSLQQNPISDAFAWSAIQLLSEHLRAVVAHPADRAGRLALAVASLQAGVAFSNAMVGCVHALGHAAGALTHIPHSVAMNIFLPWGLEFNLGKRAAAIGELLLPLAGVEAVARTPAADRPQAAIAAVRALQADLYTACGLPRALQEAGVPAARLEAIAALAINDGSAMLNPTELRLEDARRLVRAAYPTPLTP